MTEPPTREPENRSPAPLGDEALRRAFERLPHGLAVVAPSGAMRTANAALRELLDLPPGLATCRAALGCRVPTAGRPGAGCGGACVVASALARGEDVVDVPVTLPGGGRALLSAAALDDARRAAVLEVVPIRMARRASLAGAGIDGMYLAPDKDPA